MPQTENEPSPNQGGMAGAGPPEEGSKAQSQHPSPPLSFHKIFQLLSALPTTRSRVEWINAFHGLLARLLEDAVDHIAVEVNFDCPLAPQEVSTPAPPGGTVQRTRRFQHGAGVPQSPLVRTAEFEALLKRSPATFEYHFQDCYLGTILLLQEGAEGIAPATHALIEELEPFVTFVFTDLVARYASTKPIRKVFKDVVEAIAIERHLTEREEHVLKHHLLGRKYSEIKDELFISIDTVKKHVKRIHRKTGARSATELFARYFTPLIDDDEEKENREE